MRLLLRYLTIWYVPIRQRTSPVPSVMDKRIPLGSQLYKFLLEPNGSYAEVGFGIVANKLPVNTLVRETGRIACGGLYNYEILRGFDSLKKVNIINMLFFPFDTTDFIGLFPTLFLTEINLTGPWQVSQGTSGLSHSLWIVIRVLRYHWWCRCIQVHGSEIHLLIFVLQQKFLLFPIASLLIALTILKTATLEYDVFKIWSEGRWHLQTVGIRTNVQCIEYCMLIMTWLITQSTTYLGLAISSRCDHIYVW